MINYVRTPRLPIGRSAAPTCLPSATTFLAANNIHLDEQRQGNDYLSMSRTVVYFDQWTGALHYVRWLKFFYKFFLLCLAHCGKKKGENEAKKQEKQGKNKIMHICFIFWPAFECCALQTLVKIEEKAHFFGNKTVDQRSGANSKKLFFAQICCKFLAFLGFLQQKCWKWLFQALAKIYNTYAIQMKSCSYIDWKSSNNTFI